MNTQMAVALGSSVSPCLSMKSVTQKRDNTPVVAEPRWPSPPRGYQARQTTTPCWMMTLAGCNTHCVCNACYAITSNCTSPAISLSFVASTVLTAIQTIERHTMPHNGTSTASPSPSPSYGTMFASAFCCVRLNCASSAFTDSLCTSNHLAGLTMITMSVDASGFGPRGSTWLNSASTQSSRG